MKTFYVVVTHELQAYREAIGLYLRGERPGMHVVICSPDVLDIAIDELRPGFVICGTLTSRLLEAGRAGDLGWLLWYPRTGAPSVVCQGGNERILEPVTLSQVLEAVDLSARPNPSSKGRRQSA